ncbi:MAG: hypothetical protein HC923_05550 [Myxococcales bacterium]|nr:hypothetical protein [Myxococcales bacterium]
MSVRSVSLVLAAAIVAGLVWWWVSRSEHVASEPRSNKTAKRSAEPSRTSSDRIADHEAGRPSPERGAEHAGRAPEFEVRADRPHEGSKREGATPSYASTETNDSEPSSETEPTAVDASLTPPTDRDVIEQAKRLSNRSSQGILPVRGADGSEGYDVSGRFRHVPVATVEPDGTIRIREY